MGLELERRTFQMSEIRAVAEEALEPLITGHAAVFNELSENLGGFYERIDPGAFATTVQNADVRALWNHNPDYPLGRTRAGTLELAEDLVGLSITIHPPDTQYARDLMVSMIRGDVTQMSFGFTTVRDRWEQLGGQTVRTLLEVELFDVSPVTYPAYPQTSAAVRAQLEAFNHSSQAADDGASERAAAQVRNVHRKRKLTIESLK